jgi:hypothetical protein
MLKLKEKVKNDLLLSPAMAVTLFGEKWQLLLGGRSDVD